MTGRPERRPALHEGPAADLVLHPGSLHTGWCTTCKAWTHITTDLLLLAPGGVSVLGRWAWCEICDDPDSPLPTRRIDRAGP